MTATNIIKFIITKEIDNTNVNREKEEMFLLREIPCDVGFGFIKKFCFICKIKVFDVIHHNILLVISDNNKDPPAAK
jgi:hypothetical protein